MPLITPDDYLKRRDIIYYEDWNKKLEKTMMTTLEKINNFLKEIHINDVQVTSGWRPQQLNDSIKNAAVKSKHITCEAVDLLDMKPFLLMHAMGPNVSGVIGSAVVAGVLLALLG
jgi:Na+-transporting methylmalonyl-CoA/oxaloacetate decarboxylase beta subunit